MALLLLIGFVWLAFYALIVLLVIAGISTVIFFTRSFLLKQGIIKRGQPPAGSYEHDEVTVIETEYQDVTQEKKPNDAD